MKLLSSIGYFQRTFPFHLLSYSWIIRYMILRFTVLLRRTGILSTEKREVSNFKKYKSANYGYVRSKTNCYGSYEILVVSTGIYRRKVIYWLLLRWNPSGVVKEGRTKEIPLINIWLSMWVKFYGYDCQTIWILYGMLLLLILLFLRLEANEWSTGLTSGWVSDRTGWL